jgi:tetratricopeptide (TPR) repeat protein
MRRAAIALLLAAGWPAAAADDAAKDKWVRLSTANFELYTTAGEKTGRETIQYFEQVRGFFQKASPVGLPPEFPLRIVVFKNREQFLAYTANPIEAAYYVAGDRHDTIAIADPSPATYPLAIHEYMHLLIRHSGLRLPVWLNEGWADVYSTLRPVRGGVAVGDLIPARVQALASGDLLPFETLTSVDSSSPDYNEASRAGMFYGESWALAHMLYLAPDYSAGFGKFVMALDRGKTAAEACRIAWDKSSDEVFGDLKNYFARKKLYGRVFETMLGKTEEQPAVSPVSPFDARLMLADLLAAIGRIDKATEQYQALEQQQPGQPAVARSLGYLALESRDAPGARSWFEKAFEEGESDARMCFKLASMEREANAPADRIIAPLQRAVESKPDYTDAQLQLGIVQVAVRDFAPAIQTLLSIRRITPAYATPLFTSLAYAYLRTGDLEQARKNLDAARKWAANPTETSGVDRLAGLIDARSKGPLAPQPGERTVRVSGVLETVDCRPGGTRLHVAVERDAVRTFDLPDPKAVEFTHNGRDSGELRLTCGPQKPMALIVDYAPSSVLEQGSTGVVRGIEY